MATYKKEKKYLRGEIYYVEEDENEITDAYIQSMGRPYVIVSNDIGNQHSPVCMMAPLTTKRKKPLPMHVQISSALKKSTVLCEQVKTIYQSRIGEYIGKVTSAEQKRIDESLIISFGIGTNLNRNEIIEQYLNTIKKQLEENKFVIDETTLIIDGKVVNKEKVETVKESKEYSIENQCHVAEKEVESALYKKMYEDILKIVL